MSNSIPITSEPRFAGWVRAPPPATILYSTSNIQHSTAIDLSFGFVWKKALPDQFVRIGSFARRILFPHLFPCHQRPILTWIGGAHCAGNICHPRRRRFCLKFLRCVV